jgi:uncharacterized protein YycO
MCRPGDIFLVQITGRGGWLIRLGQALSGDWSRYTHTGIVLNDDTVISAQPGGAEIIPLSEILSQRPLAFSHYDLSDETRAKIVAKARSLEGTPYSFLDYLSLALVTFKVRPKWLIRYVANTGHMICSQLIDYVYFAGGVELFNDGRFFGDVTPGDVAHVGLIKHIPGPWVREL